MIVEVGDQVRKLTGEISGYLGVLGLSPRTYRSWVEGYALGQLAAHRGPEPLTEEIPVLEALRSRMFDLAHQRHYTFGLESLWQDFRGRVRRQTFRRMARQVRREVNRERRAMLMRYEFTHPDVAHSIDYTELPRELPGSSRRYMIKILDERVRLTLRWAISAHKGAGIGTAFVRDHFEAGRVPLAFKYDREFATPQFERLLRAYRVAPLPSPAAYPPFNGKLERSNKDTRMWLGAFVSDRFWCYDELKQELDLCFERLDRLEVRPELGGLTRQQAYEQWDRAHIDRERFFNDAIELHHAILYRPGVRVDSNDAWRVATKETLKRYELVRYLRP